MSSPVKLSRSETPIVAVSIVPYEFEATTKSSTVDTWADVRSDSNKPAETEETVCPQCGRTFPAMSTKLSDVRNRYNQNVSQEDKRVDDMPARSRERSIHGVVKLVVSVLAGFAFGIALEKGRVFEPEIIRKQMLFTNFTMLKMFLSAMATGMLSFGVLSLIPATAPKFEAALDGFMAAMKRKSFLGAGIGGFILGCGMTLSGACPGMVLAQVGANVPNAGYTLLGGFAGAFLYASLDGVLTRLLSPRKPYNYESLDEVLDTPYSSLAFPFAALVAIAVFAVEVFIPWTSEVEQTGSGLMGSRAWPPYLAGMLIGSMQIPVVLVLEDTLGSSTSYVTLASQVLAVSPLRSIWPYFRKYRFGVMNWWQVFFVGGAILGAHFSAQASDTLSSVNGVSFPYAFGGGILLIFGSRLAGGCTSGHGLSGMSLAILHSFFAVPAMFAGGIGLAMLLKHGLNVDIDHL